MRGLFKRKTQTGLNESFLLAACEGELVETLVLLKKGADINTADTHGRTALHFAANWGKTEITLTLLRHGASFTVQDNEGNTPLELAKPGICQKMIEQIGQRHTEKTKNVRRRILGARHGRGTKKR